MLLDTTPDMEARQVEIWRKMGAEKRLRLGFEMRQFARNLTTSRIRAEHPDWSERQVKIEALRCAFLPNEMPAWLR